MRLSERLLDEAEGYGPGPTTLQADEVRQLATLLREAAALAKRYEDASVITFEDPDLLLFLADTTGFVGEHMQRVRIVLDKEG